MKSTPKVSIGLTDGKDFKGGSMKLVKKDANLVYGKNASKEENELVQLGLQNKGLCLLVNKSKVLFTPTKDNRTLKTNEKVWVELPHGTEVDVEIE